jgi:hypothetical protein
MGTLNKAEIERRLLKGELLKNARRRDDGTFDLEPASYDLMAGTAVWKEPTRNGNALFDLYAKEMQEALQLHTSSVEARIRTDLTGDFVKKSTLFKWCTVIAVVIALIQAWPKIANLIGGSFK